MRPDDWLVAPGERALVVGATGSGKTVMLLAQARYRGQPVIILDTKGDDGFLHVAGQKESLEIVSSMSQFRALSKRPARKRPDYTVIQPTAEEVQKPAMVDAYLQAAYESLHGHTVIIDEAYQVHEGGRAGVGLLSLLTRGRSRGIATIMGSQRPRWLSRFCMTESQRLYVYRIADTDDAKRLSEVSPYPKLPMKLDKFSFWAYKQGEEMGQVFAPIPIPSTWDMGFSPAPEIQLAIKWV